MFRGEKGTCRHCQQPRWIVNKRRYACQSCNEKLKKAARITPSRQERNQDYYHEKWNSVPDPHYCEECGKYLKEYSAVYISHILPRSAYPELAWDLRNSNILCWTDHNRWEDPGKRIHMRIYKKNKIIIQTLLKELRESWKSPQEK